MLPRMTAVCVRDFLAHIARPAGNCRTRAAIDRFWEAQPAAQMSESGRIADQVIRATRMADFSEIRRSHQRR
jgi:hypothetical protein